MGSGDGPRLLARERRELDPVAESIREGRRVAAFLVCPEALRPAALEHLSERAGRGVPWPVEATEAGQVMALLSEAADAREGDVRCVALDAAMEDTVHALNWHREKLRRGASVLVWLADLEALQALRRQAPDAYSFRDALVVVEGERPFPVVRADVNHQDVRLARLKHEQARTPFARMTAAYRLASELRARDATEDALHVLAEALATPPGGESRAESARDVAALLHAQLGAVLEREARLVEARSAIMRGIGHLRYAGWVSSWWPPSPLGQDHRALLCAIETAQGWERWWSDAPLRGVLSDAEHGGIGPARRSFAPVPALRLLKWLARPAKLELQAQAAMRTGGLAEVEPLLRQATLQCRLAGAGNETAALALARCQFLQGEIAAAQRVLRDVAAGEEGPFVPRCLARRALHAIAVERGAVSEGLAGLRDLLDDPALSGRDGLLYEIASTYAGCVVSAHGAARVTAQEILEAEAALRRAQDTSCALSGEDPPWYHALYPMLRGRVLSLLPGRASEAIDMTRAALELCERAWRDAAPLLARTLTEHLVRAGRHEEALSVVERATPQLVEERHLEGLGRARAAKAACLAHLRAAPVDIEAGLADLRATLAEMDAPRITAETLLGLCLLLPADAPHPDALPLLEEAQELFADMPIVASEARCLEAMGDVLAARGDAAEARGRYRMATGLLEGFGLLLRVPLLAARQAGSLPGNGQPG